MSAACTTEPNAADGATYTCTSAEDSDVSACKDGFWEDVQGSLSNQTPADVCTGACADETHYPFSIQARMMIT